MRHTSAHVSIRQLTSAGLLFRRRAFALKEAGAAYVSIRQHTSAYASIRQHGPIRHMLLNSTTGQQPTCFCTSTSSLSAAFSLFIYKYKYIYIFVPGGCEVVDLPASGQSEEARALAFFDV
jgi:hypothetical protein